MYALYHTDMSSIGVDHNSSEFQINDCALFGFGLGAGSCGHICRAVQNGSAHVHT